MNEKEIQALIHNLDNNLIEKEIDLLMKENEIEIDIEKIAEKSKRKLINEMNKERLKMKRKKLLPFAVASLAIVAGTSTIYATEISDFFKSLSNKTQVYNNVVDGDAYYLKSPVQLDDTIRLDSVLLVNDNLEMELSFTPDLSDFDNLPTFSASINGEEYNPGGYGDTVEGGLFLDFYNQEDGGYLFEIDDVLELFVGDASYTIQLTEGAALLEGGEVHLAETVEIEWMDLGHQETEEGLQIITSFDDEDLVLAGIGGAVKSEYFESFENTDNGGSGSSSPRRNLPIFGYDTDGNSYEFTKLSSENGGVAPYAILQYDIPENTAVELKIPGISVRNETNFGKINVTIPEIGSEVEISQEIDVGLQKMVLDSIKRTSDTTGEMVFTLNTGDKEEVKIHNVSIHSADLTSGQLVWSETTCTMDVVFPEGLKEMELEFGWP